MSFSTRLHNTFFDGNLVHNKHWNSVKGYLVLVSSLGDYIACLKMIVCRFISGVNGEENEEKLISAIVETTTSFPRNRIIARHVPLN